ncbi:MAG: hypothetical protein OIF56_06570 [Cohaesibacter sp.]|nr:hypothetical protein [Cohaesibacter sp.]MCV6600323.1 hypothetical protein [Cohaesibacter sp.]
MTSSQKNSYHKSIDRFEYLLDAARSREIDTPYKLAQITGIPQSTAYRQIALMEKLRLISRDMQGRFMIGPESLRLANKAWDIQDIEVLAEPILRFIRIQTRQTGFLGFVANGDIQLGLYSIGLGCRFNKPTKSGLYHFLDVIKPLTSGRYDLVDDDGLRQPVILCPVVGNDHRELVIGLLKNDQKDETTTDDLALVTDVVNRFRAGLALVSQKTES